ncbi:Nmad5 family putative nucleotide modification protein [Proteus mirabilis]|uniref:Nmad5 family putative nucleotide modification protein n=1 Tax=Proteus mirabilis TaxID=584 RepID=UPI0023F6B930|nr:Nmad5 family putative nucleotide modification protein [Proteus mirabilis]MDF7217664.1 Nmad5 family putative nucleotide modification protein [Proteus mirabilis]MDF7260314.1 Nmad5 family putative nucleotide modification protein [Proteus mirabilis]MDF7296964.1 Nmad5 family putative nucleotide modification protein [Proteus mirabilis]MDF7314778.1 Nmad5 family putative nucleotide modification protein [Proteus mirabilis]
MTRLTNSLKEVITQNALEKSGVVQQQKELDLEYNKLALEVRIEALGGESKAKEMDGLYSKADEIAEKLRQSVNEDIGVRYALGHRLYASFGGMRLWLKYGKKENGDNTCLLTPCDSKCLFAADHPLSIKFSELEDKKRNITNKVKDVKANVTATLNSVTTVKRLLTIWPEAKELLPKDVEKASIQLPALKVEKLNEIIGLPTEKAA